jgi:hypothetical protein
MSTYWDFLWNKYFACSTLFGTNIFAGVKTIRAQLRAGCLAFEKDRLERTMNHLFVFTQWDFFFNFHQTLSTFFVAKFLTWVAIFTIPGTQSFAWWILTTFHHLLMKAFGHNSLDHLTARWAFFPANMFVFTWVV